MKNIVKAILLAVLAALMLASMVGCKEVSNSTAINIVNNLVQQSYELNVIYFGEGMEAQEIENESDLYAPVRGNSNYTSKLALMEKTRQIFSEAYSSNMIELAFEGEAGAIGSSAVYARYIEFEGYLFVRRDIDGIEVAKYDFTTTKILKNSKKFIIAKIKTKNTDKPEYVEITLINEKNGWRIDSATY